MQRMISMRGMVPQANYMQAATRAIRPMPEQAGVPAAPGLSSRISPGTVPMKKGMR